ncbi:hypothetical protein QR97_01890 [Streptomyces sp. PBH53]|uniref:hypothetical protein n=1 Tax=Streptomyces sp. PBH53 TaxID=1577075 RepID=UPI000654D7C4|nr:hypothetical protein [Streptomyces sp. PBH53]AKN68719.1 hypothetical protein QR97_01890 [Streptomyces sp. PBH53]
MPRAPHHNLTVPEHKRLRTEAEQQVMAELAKIARPDDRFKRACEIVQQADLEIAAHVDERNQAAMSLWFYEGVRGLNNVLGITPNAYVELRRRALHQDTSAKLTVDDERMTAEERRQAARDAKIPEIKDAADRLPSLSATVSVATARRKAALPILQDTALVLFEEPYGWTTERLGEVGGFSAKYARDAKNAAKRRRGH